MSLGAHLAAIATGLVLLHACQGALPAPAASPESPSMSTRPVRLTARFSYEQRQGDGWAAYPYREAMPPVALPGDRAWLTIDTAPEDVVYLVGSDLSWRYWRIPHAAAPGASTRAAFPTGWVLDEAQRGMRTLTVIAAASPNPTLEALDTWSCAGPVAGVPREDGPCALLAHLGDLAPPRVQGLVAPFVTIVPLPHGPAPAVTLTHTRAGMAAVELYFARPPVP